MNVKELIEQLKTLPDNARVIVSDMDGDIHPFSLAIHDEGYASTEKEAEFIINLYKGKDWNRESI